jgi:hypothetical protein
MKKITDIKQMHHRPGKRYYVMSWDGIPRYCLSCKMDENGRWYGWVSVIEGSEIKSIENPFFPMSDTAKGAVRNELHKTKYVDRSVKLREAPVEIHEFKNLEEAKEYFAPFIKERWVSQKYPFVWIEK